MAPPPTLKPEGQHILCPPPPQFIGGRRGLELRGPPPPSRRMLYLGYRPSAKKVREKRRQTQEKVRKFQC